MEEAAVGSISHILKTAFKDVYEDYRQRDALDAQRKEMGEIETRIKAAMDAKKIADEEAAQKHVKVKQLDATQLQLQDERNQILMADEKRLLEIKNNLSSAPSLKLSDQHQRVLTEKKNQLDNELKSHHEKGASLINYLKEQKLHAKNLESLEEEDLKRQGIMIGQHIPSLTSKLDLNPRILNEFGEVASNVVIAHELIEQNRDNTLRRTGNLPISDAAENRKLERRSFRDSMATEGPHYLQKTSLQDNRHASTQVRFSATIAYREHEKEKETQNIPGNNDMKTTSSSSTTKLLLKKKKKRGEYISAEERDKESAILKGMQHKLNYLKHPRSDPAAMSKMLIKPKQQQQSPSNINGPSRNNNTHNDNNEDLPLPPASIALFLAEPSVVSFTSYDLGDTCTQSISFRNVSSNSRHVRVIPPSSKVFGISALKYPPKSVGGCVAPGIVVTATVSFRPDSLGDYEDSLLIETEGGSFTVPLLACREAPKLSIPSLLDLGICLVGDAMRVVVPCVNTGGPGRFRLLDTANYPDIPPDMDWSTMGCVRIPPFTIYPVEFTLRRNQSIDLNIDFVPLTIGEQSRSFVALCDNLQSRTFTLRAMSKQVSISIIEINSRRVDPLNTKVVRDLVFAPAFIGSETEQKVIISNETGLALEYEWVWIEPRTRDLRKSGQAQLSERAREEVEQQRQSELRGRGGQDITNTSNNISNNNNISGDGLMDFESQTPMNSAVKRRKNESMNKEKEGFNSLLDSLNASEEFSANRVVRRALELTLARGVLPSDGMEEVKILYRPDAMENSGYRAVLMLKGVPAAAVPEPVISSSFPSSAMAVGTGADKDKEGVSILERKNSSVGMSTDQQLAAAKRRGSVSVGGSADVAGMIRNSVIGGPGAVRKNSIVAVDHVLKLSQKGHGSFVRLSSWIDAIGIDVVPETIRASDPEKTTRVVTLKTLLNMAMDHAASEMVDPTGILKMGTNVRMLLEYVFSLLQGETIMDDDDTTTVSSRLSTHLSSIASASKASRATSGVLSAMYWDKESDVEAEWVPPYKVPQAHEIHDEDRLPEGLGELPPEKEKLLNQIFVDVKNSLFIMGAAVCGVLDMKVKHEAVDYIRSIARMNLPCICFEVMGDSKQPVISVTPPVIAIGGVMSVGKSWEGKVKLKNLSNVMTEVFANQSGLRITALDNRGLFPVPAQCQIDMFPSRIILMPDAEEVVEISMILAALGHFQITLPLSSTNKSALIQDIVLTANVTGPRLRFECSEIDFGLIGVGLENKKFINIFNESDVSLKFLYQVTLEQDYDSQFAGAAGGGGYLSFRNLSTSRPASRSGTSDVETASSVSGSEVHTAISSKDSFAIQGSSTATITLDPPSSELGPGQAMAVQVTCYAGKQPQRIRGMFECRLFESSGVISLPSQYLSFRGEVQVPKVILYPMEIDLGKVYIGTPVKFDVTIRNLSNLPSKFKFERPGGNSMYFKLNFDKTAGSLGPKSIQTIHVEYTALASGITDDTISCKIFGATNPLGFAIKAAARGVLVEFVTLTEGQSVPEPLGKPTDVQYLGEDKIPDPAPPTHIEFGSDIKLYDRKVGRLAIRNLSAVAAHYSISARKYRVPDALAETLPTVGSEHNSRGLGTLTINEDGDNRFHSKAGKDQMRGDLMRKEDQGFLGLHLGAAYSIDPVEGIVPPWGVKVVTIRAYNDMPGCFDDELVFDIKDSRKVIIPVKMSVAGCPLVIEKDTVGMTVVKKVSVPDMSPGSQLLQLGFAVVNGEQLVRQFRVRNNGSGAAKISWKVRSVSSKVNGPIKLELKVGDDKSVKSKLVFWDDVEKFTPFTIEPEHAVISSFGRQSFNVRMNQMQQDCIERACLTARAVFVEDGLITSSVLDFVNSASLGSLTSSRSVHTSAAMAPPKNGYKLSLFLEGKTIHPALQIDKKIVIANDSVNELEASCGIFLKAHAPLLFARDGNKSNVCANKITLTNPTNADLTFSVATDGPFVLRNFSSGVMEDGTGPATRRPPGETGGGSTVGRTYNLTPASVATLSLSYTPRKDLRESLAQGTGVLDAISTCKEGANEDSGRLVISFATGPRILVPINVTLSTPFILASSPKLHFGVCHVTKVCNGTVLLSNATDVCAAWTVVHVPDNGLGKKPSAIRVKGFTVSDPPEDDAAVFSITPNGGVLEGPTGPVTTAMATSKTITVRQSGQKAVKFAETDTKMGNATTNVPLSIAIRFSPKKDIRYSSRYRFSCEYGNSFDIVLEGVGTYEEHLHLPTPPVPR